MATLASLQFEMERRSILFTANTTMPDNSLLGFEGNPNSIISPSTPGEILIYNSPQGTHYLELVNGILWFKEAIPNSWSSVANIQDLNYLSGYANNTFATITNLISTGENLQNQIYNLDINYVNQAEFDILSGNLISTGVNLQSQINSLYSSGFLTGIDLSPYYLKSNPSGFITGVDLSNYATVANLELTGQNLQTQINNLDSIYATDTSLAQTGQFLDQKINTFSGTYQTFVNNLDNNYASQAEFNNLSGNLNSTGQNLENKINTLSGAAVLVYGDQFIDGQKIFRGEIRVKDLYVTGTQTIVNTTNTNVGSNYLLLNATGGAIDAGIFIVTGNGLTGINNTGAIIGYDIPANRWVFGNASRSSDLNQLEKIAGISDIINYSGFANSTFATINNLATTGSTLQTNINTVAANLATTGAANLARINSLSGYSNATFATITNLAATGSNLQTQINNLDSIYATDANVTAVANNLATTGSTLNTKIDNLSGYSNATFATITNLASTGSILAANLAATGAANLARINSLSGTLTSNYATISNLATTGSILNTLINNLSGYSNSTFATITNLSATGSTLNAQINNLSGYVNSTSSNIVFTTGNQTISGIKNFNLRPTVNSTGIALTGEIVNKNTNTYIIVQPGDNLATKYTEAKALTPNGSAKSATNRASLIIMPGNYTLASELNIDAEFVDIIGIGAQKLGRGAIPAVNILNNTLNVTANDIRVKGVSVSDQQFKIGDNLPLQRFEDCTGGDNSFTDFSTSAGTFINCSAGNSSFVSFNLNGTYVNCKAGSQSFNCQFGGFIFGIFTNCESGSDSFGSTSGPKASGTFTDCIAGDNSFGAAFNPIADGKFTNCVGGANSFGAGGSASGLFINCVGDINSFGNNTFVPGTASGKFYNCRITSGLFQEISGEGIMRNCIDGNNNIVDQ